MLLGVNTPESITSKIKSIATSIKYFTQKEDILIDELKINSNIVKFLVLDNDEISKIDEMLNNIKGIDIKKSKDLYYTITLTEDQIKLTKEQSVLQAVETIRNRLDQFGLSEPNVMRQGDEDIVVQLPGIKNSKDEQKARDLISKPANLELMAIDEDRADQVYSLSNQEAAK